jgi:hypothetical protein
MQIIIILVKKKLKVNFLFMIKVGILLDNNEYYYIGGDKRDIGH